MCDCPVSIKNPNYGRKSLVAFGKDVVSERIYVPCGHCPACIAVRQMNWVQRLQMESLTNYLFFCTLTYNNESLPIVTTSTGYDIRYADVSDVQKMFKRLRKSNAFGRPFRHFSVSELGSQRARPHFHIVFLVPKFSNDDFRTPLILEKKMFDAVLAEWRRNYGSNRKPIWKPLCTYVRKMVRGRLRTNYDLHYVSPSASKNGESDVAFYVLKYMMKPSEKSTRLRQALSLNLDEEEYESIWSLVKPRHFESENLGLSLKHPPDKIYKHLRLGIESSKGISDYPLFLNPISGKPFPLARYYRNKGNIFSVQDFLDFDFNSKNKRADNVVIQDHVIEQELTKERMFEDNVALVDLKSDSNSFDVFFD